VRQVLESIHSGFALLPIPADARFGLLRDLSQKLSTMKESLLKVENVCCQVTIRGSEYPREMLASQLQDMSVRDGGGGGGGDEE